MSLNELHCRKLHPNETPTLYLHQLKKALQQTIPVPTEVSCQLRMTNETDLETLVDQACLLMTIDDKVCSAALEENSWKENCKVQKLQEQIAALMEQVAAVTTAATEARRPQAAMHCFACNKLGHTQYECHSRHQQNHSNSHSFVCNCLGHLAREWHLGKDNGTPLRAGRRPTNQEALIVSWWQLSRQKQPLLRKFRRCGD